VNLTLLWHFLLRACELIFLCVYPGIGHGGPEEEYRYSSTLSLTSGLDGGGWSTPRPIFLYESKK
jgi:hypothetical protein